VTRSSQDEITVLKKTIVLGKATPESLARELGEPYTVQDLSAHLKSLEKKTLLSLRANPSIPVVH